MATETHGPCICARVAINVIVAINIAINLPKRPSRASIRLNVLQQRRSGDAQAARNIYVYTYISRAVSSIDSSVVM